MTFTQGKDNIATTHWKTKYSKNERQIFLHIKHELAEISPLLGNFGNKGS